MTINITGNIKKALGWCPDANHFATKRFLVTLPCEEEFLMDDKRKSGVDPIKMDWGYRYRNYILLMTLANFVAFGLTLFLSKYFEFVFAVDFILKGILIGALLAALLMVLEWRQLNNIKEVQFGLMKNVFFKTLTQTALFWTIVILMTFTIGKVNPVVFLLTLFFPYILIRYPIVVYWERKNSKTIYLVEENFLRWKSMVLPSIKE
ncbi:MAG: DUF1673 family protein [Candidatus Methanoperedens sp.]|nr:DUF1673 family protein [Candidatus Methanoperedens sp.]